MVHYTKYIGCVKSAGLPPVVPTHPDARLAGVVAARRAVVRLDGELTRRVAAAAPRNLPLSRGASLGHQALGSGPATTLASSGIFFPGSGISRVFSGLGGRPGSEPMLRSFTVLLLSSSPGRFNTISSRSSPRGLRPTRSRTSRILTPGKV